MSQLPLLPVTVIVPIHNGSEFLCETLDALLAQTFPDFEVLCVDDGSTDNSLDLLQQYNDTRIRIVRQAQAGLCHTLNRGISEARGVYIARNDQDDISLPDRLQRQRDLLEHNREVDCLFSNYVRAGKAKSRYQNVIHAGDHISLTIGTAQFSQHGSSMMAKRSVLLAIGGYRQEYYPADDWDLQLRLVERSCVWVMQDPVVTYRYHLGANTYPTFRKMMENSRWASFNHERRLSQHSEFTREEFLNKERESPILLKLHRWLFAMGRLNMRKASQADLDGRVASAAFYAFLAAILDPLYVCRRAWLNLFNMSVRRLN